MQAAFLSFIDSFGYLAVAVLILLENVFPPIPSELVLPLSGYLCLKTSLNLAGVIIASTIGSVAGAFLLYAVGRLLSRERLESFFATKAMRLLGFKPSDVHKSIRWFHDKGQLSVLLCRFIPGIRSLISIPAGTAHMSTPKFALLTSLGSLVWNAVLCSLGFIAGEAWQHASGHAAFIMDIVKYALLCVVFLVVCWWIWKRVLPNFKQGNGCA